MRTVRGGVVSVLVMGVTVGGFLRFVDWGVDGSGLLVVIVEAKAVTHVAVWNVGVGGRGSIGNGHKDKDGGKLNYRCIFQYKLN